MKRNPSKSKIIIVIGHIKVGGYMQRMVLLYVYYPAFFVFLGKGIFLLMLKLDRGLFYLTLIDVCPLLKTAIYWFRYRFLAWNKWVENVSCLSAELGTQLLIAQSKRSRLRGL